MKAIRLYRLCKQAEESPPAHKKTQSWPTSFSCLCLRSGVKLDDLFPNISCCLHSVELFFSHTMSSLGMGKKVGRAQLGHLTCFLRNIQYHIIFYLTIKVQGKEEETGALVVMALVCLSYYICSYHAFWVSKCLPVNGMHWINYFLFFLFVIHLYVTLLLLLWNYC